MISGSREEIDPRLLEKGYSAEALAALKQAVPQTSVTSQNLRFKKHLSRYEYPLLGYVLTLFENYERGVLPYPGSLADQPAPVIEIFNVLASLKHEQEERARKQTESNVRRKYQGNSRDNR